ncbi:hypothetical protein ACQVUL_20190 [Bacillus cytotoxicus]
MSGGILQSFYSVSFARCPNLDNGRFYLERRFCIEVMSPLQWLGIIFIWIGIFTPQFLKTRPFNQSM